MKTEYVPNSIAKVTLQDCSPPAAAHPGLEWVWAVPPAARSPEEGRPEWLLAKFTCGITRIC